MCLNHNKEVTGGIKLLYFAGFVPGECTNWIYQEGTANNAKCINQSSPAVRHASRLSTFHPLTSVCTQHVGGKNNRLQLHYGRVNYKDWVIIVIDPDRVTNSQIMDTKVKQRRDIHLQCLSYLWGLNLSHYLSSGSGSNLQQWEGHWPLMWQTVLSYIAYDMQSWKGCHLNYDSISCHIMYRWCFYYNSFGKEILSQSPAQPNIHANLDRRPPIT